ncbi:MAG: hypothetical protein A2499_00385 [Stygiobacter sp. RIFOXYC12_FULL_38_8]|nr:MAG: hypothetical protein A2299_02440 [Stygiobacter sp. RIFOXYB2_FULL_37_11]OGV13199.1 MAG: hypothetical protein A2440_12780 [Stygiobacter sp. RIFOXYC2_FULL_38_25]OGV14659.1 MAG: hypothetical protein A2237_03500 [Stygiobacter sp. RIFOXYA2_FULL_38_8]OGV26442.1 MAG: hypothetical protein A2499_00385 [Stygiobacter sp. RIFOXYC12_FULL_38_8]OGV83245.1 MAG: hypothetical protein A2X65_16335 [Stygiobacter sp. GWF2_38_21]RJQ58635.1 MAG: ABC transporter permease [Stygiobacter sp.]
MKPTRILTWHIILLVSFALIIARLGEISNSLILFYLFAKLSFTDTGYFTNNLSLEFIDQFLSISILILCTAIVILKRNKWKMLSNKVGLPLSLAIVFVLIITYGAIVAPFNPSLQFNLSIAKNLPPVSVKTLVTNSGSNSKHSNPIAEFAEFKKTVMREVVDDDYYLIDAGGAAQQLANGTSRKQNNQYSKICFLLGTDEYGRDVFSRLIYATRLSVFIGIGAVIVTLIFGVLLGFLAGYYSRSAGKILNSFTDMFLAFPAIFLVILFLSLYGNSLFNVIFVIGFASWMSLFKIVRGEVISIKSKNFIITSQQLGMNKLAILRKEIIPFLMPSITVNVIFQFANIIIAESSLSFLGLTGNHVYPTLGQMVQEGQFYIKHAWWILLFPSVTIVLILFLANKVARKLQLKFSGHKFFN